MTTPTPLDELRKRPCMHGHSRLDAYEVMATNGPALRCRQCVRESNKRRKLARMADWGAFCAQRSVHYHVARVNSAKRMFAAIAAGADSVDGSSVSRYAVTLPNLDNASRQADIFAP